MSSTINFVWIKQSTIHNSDTFHWRLFCVRSDIMKTYLNIIVNTNLALQDALS